MNHRTIKRRHQTNVAATIARLIDDMTGEPKPPEPLWEVWYPGSWVMADGESYTMRAEQGFAPKHRSSFMTGAQ